MNVMLAEITTTAIARGWPANVYSRLVSQLNDSADLGGHDSVLETFENLITEAPPNPLLLEYLCTLSNEAHSLVFFPHILKRLAFSEEPSSQSVKDMIGYLGRYAANNWILPADFDNNNEIAQTVLKLITLAGSTRPELKILISGLALEVIPQLLVNTSEIKKEIEIGLSCLGISLRADLDSSSRRSAKQLTSENGSSNVDEDQKECGNQSHSGRSSRSLRLLWLDWTLRTAQSFEFEHIRKQLDIVWPGDRESVISYELCITAFDILASSKVEHVPRLAMPFITRALPFILQKLNSDSLIDSVVARIFTTLDKSIIEVVEERFPGIRAEFGAACVDIGCCDPTIMHALHRSHTRREPNDASQNLTLQDITNNPAQLLDAHPEIQRQVVRKIQDSLCQGSSYTSRHEIALLCEQLFKNPEVADLLFVYLPVRDFLMAVCSFSNLTANISNDEGGVGFAFVDLGRLLSMAQFIKTRYQNVEFPDGWTRDYLLRVKFTGASSLSPELNQIMGHWIVGVFSGRGSGIADELLRPFKELGDVLPALVQQAVRAYRSAVIDRETLKGGLNNFVHHSSVTLLAPLVVSVLRATFFEGAHQTTTLECLIFFLNMLLQNTTPDYDIGKTLVLWICREISADLEEIECCSTHQTGNYANLKKLQDAFLVLVDELSRQMSPKFFVPPTKSLKAGETTSLFEEIRAGAAALVVWQTKLQGIPAIPLSFPQAKFSLGVDLILGLIEESKISDSKEVLIAILVSDALWCSDNRLFDAKDSQPFQVAREIYQDFEQVLQKRFVPEVWISNGENTFRTEKQAEISPAQSSLTELLAPGLSDENILSSFTNNSPLMANSKGMASFYVMEGVNDSFGQDLNADPNEFDNDFVSQPMMNLADLDSAMDFAWE